MCGYLFDYLNFEKVEAFYFQLVCPYIHYAYSIIYVAPFNSFPGSGDLCRLLITFANSLDPGQDRQNVYPDLDPNCLTL